MIRTLSKLKIPIHNLSLASVSSTPRICKDTPVPSVQGPKDLIVQEKEKSMLQRQTATIEVSLREDIGVLTGIPEEHIKDRRVRIYIPSKNAMQSGTDNLHHWEIEFDTRERWENPLMGWTSSGDPHSNLKLEFKTQANAIDYCEKMGFKWYLDVPKIVKNETPKNYGVNFSWNKRSRVTTK